MRSNATQRAGQLNGYGIDGFSQREVNRLVDADIDDETPVTTMPYRAEQELRGAALTRR
jgi:hypothetical protein